MASGLGSSVALVDGAAEELSSPDRRVGWDHHGGVVLGRTLAQAQVRAVPTKVREVFVEDLPCVALVVDQHAVRTGCPHWVSASIGAGPTQASARMRRMVPAATRWPRPDQLTLDFPVPPRRVLLRQAQDESADLTADRWSACLVGVGPVPLDQTAMPGQQCRRSDDPMRPQLAGKDRLNADSTARSGTTAAACRPGGAAPAT